LYIIIIIIIIITPKSLPFSWFPKEHSHCPTNCHSVFCYNLSNCNAFIIYYYSLHKNIYIYTYIPWHYYFFNEYSASI